MASFWAELRRRNVVRVVIAYSATVWAILLAWYFKITAEGIRAADNVPAGAERRFSGRQVNYAIIGLLPIAIAFLVIDNYMHRRCAARASDGLEFRARWGE